MPTIQARGLTKRFGAHVLAVDHLDFDAIPGGVTGFLGPNGAGKTTTLRMLLGLVTPTSGTVLVDGHPYRELPNPTGQVGAVLEASGFHPARSARNHLKLTALMSGIAFSRVEECLELVGLKEAGDRKVGGYSMGMRQRLELARALLGKPDILVLDEPANGLDPQGIAWLRDFLRFYASDTGPGDSGRIVIVSTPAVGGSAHCRRRHRSHRRAPRRPGSSLGPACRHEKVRQGSHADAERLVRALHAANLPASALDGYVVSEGATPEQIGPVMVENRIEVHEMYSSTESLESLFFSLTGGERGLRGQAGSPVGDYGRLPEPPAPSPATVPEPGKRPQ